MRQKRMLAATFLIGASIFAANSNAIGGCSTSKKFKLPQHQQLSGSFEDPYGAVLEGFGVELLAGRSAVRKVTTDRVGRYDFDDIAPGEYRLRVIHGDEDFCAPKIHCDKSRCTIEPQLKPNPKHMITVEAAGK